MITPADQYGVIYKKLQEAGIPVDPQNSGLEHVPTAALEVNISIWKLHCCTNFDFNLLQPAFIMPISLRHWKPHLSISFC